MTDLPPSPFTHQECYDLFKKASFLSHPTHIMILSILLKYGGKINVMQLSEMVMIGQSTLSHHLQNYRAKGWVRVDWREGNAYYSVNKYQVFEDIEWLIKILKGIEA